MAARQIIVPGAQPSRDANGRSLAAYLYFYNPDTGAPKTVYADAGLSTELPFPLPSDSAGRFVPIWAEETETFDVVWTDRDNVTQQTYDDIQPLSDAILASGELAQSAADIAVDAAADATDAAA